MKKVITFLAALIFCGGLFAQAPLKMDWLSNPVPTNNNTTVQGTQLTQAQVQSAMQRFGNQASTKRGLQGAWLCYANFIDKLGDSLNNDNGSTSTHKLYAGTMWPDSLPYIKYSNGNFHPFVTGIGNTFDPYAKGFSYFGSGFSLDPSIPYTVDSMAIWYLYNRFKNSASTVDTLKIALFNDSAYSSGFPGWTFLSVHKNNSGTWTKDTVHVNNVPTFGYDWKKNMAKVPGMKTYKLLLKSNDTSNTLIGTKSWPVHMNVQAGSITGSNIAFFPGATYKLNDTVGNKNLNRFSFVTANELGTDSLAVLNVPGFRGGNMSHISVKQNKYHLFKFQLDSLFCPPQIWSGPINYNQHFIFYHITFTSGVNNVTQTIKNIMVYPNPTNSVAVLSFDAKNAGRVRINLFDITGRLVNTIADFNATTGLQQVSVSTQNLSNGLYLISIEDGSNATVTRKLVVKH